MTLSVLLIPANPFDPIETLEIERNGAAIRAVLGIDNSFEVCPTGHDNMEFIIDEEGPSRQTLSTTAGLASS